VLADHLRTLLQAGVSVVLDFPFNTPAARGHVKCSRRLALHINCISSTLPTRSARRGCARNALGEHPFQASDEEFEQITRHFVAPAAEEASW
jgi:predicted kinase